MADAEPGTGIGLLDAGGARYPGGVSSLRAMAKSFKRNVLASGVVPQISMMRWGHGAGA